MNCAKCLELQPLIKIDSPKVLDECIAKIKEFIELGTICLEKDNSWSSDYIEKIYKCNHCENHFRLRAEMYHGQGGEWKELTE